MIIHIEDLATKYDKTIKSLNGTLKNINDNIQSLNDTLKNINSNNTDLTNRYDNIYKI